MAKILPHQRLLVILGEYGEYPSHYRNLIWKSLLKLPNNTFAYTNLIEKCIHNRTRFRYRDISPYDPIVRKNLQKLIAYLTQWSRILTISFDSEKHFLPHFVLPFMKLCSNNLMLSFELIATILLNQCSMWFEFSPLLPLNYLGIIENLIDHYEPSLMEFYRRHSIDSTVYAWSMLQTAFSEVLEEFQWRQIWDHILSGPSYFLVFITVAFNTTQRLAIVQLKNPKEIKRFFDEPSTINLRFWIRCAYYLMDHCPANLHPKQYMPNFVSLNSNDDQYRRISNYPQDIFNERIQQKKSGNRQMQLINQKYMELDRFESKLMQQMVNNVQVDEHHRRLQKVESSHNLAALKQLSRTEHQRQQLILFERQLNDREALMELIIAENARLNEINQWEHDLQKNSCDLKSRVS